jgi:hypothetical protein
MYQQYRGKPSPPSSVTSKGREGRQSFLWHFWLM